jgi:hypothetical protein
MPLHHHLTLLELGEDTQTKLSNSFEKLDFDLTNTTQQLQITNNQTKTKKKQQTNALTIHFPHFPLFTRRNRSLNPDLNRKFGHSFLMRPEVSGEERTGSPEKKTAQNRAPPHPKPPIQ